MHDDTDRDALATRKFDDRLTAAQMMTLRTIQHQGWELRFIGLSSGKRPIPVLYNHGGEQMGIVEEDGYFDVARI